MFQSFPPIRVLALFFLEVPHPLYYYSLLNFFSMKKVFFLMVAFAFVGTAAMAQLEQKDYKKSQEEWDKKVKEELKLTNDQVVKYDALGKEYGDKMSAIAQDATLSKDAQKEKKMALKKEKEAKLFEFLTSEQQTKYKELIEQKKKEMEKQAKG
jgi:hypothetical protein